MSDNGASALPSQTFVECGKCRSINVSWFCKNCPISLCARCARSHKSKEQYKTHAVVPRTYTVVRSHGPAKIAVQCQIHNEKEISAYCKACNVPCCVSCLINDHKSHDLSIIEDKYLEAEAGLNKYCKTLDTELRTTLENMKEETKADAEEDERNAKKVINDIKDFRKEIVENVDKSCYDLIAQVEKSQSKKTKRRLDEIQKCRENLVSLKQEIERKIQNGNLDIISYDPPKLESLISELKITKSIVPWFEQNRKILDAINESVGKLIWMHVTKDETGSIKSLLSLNANKVNSFKCEMGVSSITKAAGNTAWLVHYSISKMFHYNDIGKKVISFSLKDSNGINDMVIKKSGELIVTCRDMKVRLVSGIGRVIAVFGRFNKFDCLGVCLTDKEEIVVCMRGDNDNHYVAIYSPDGRNKVREIRAVDKQGKQVLTNPYRVVVNGHDLCVVNGGIDVVCMTERGDVRWVYDGEEATHDGPFDPSGICVDKYDNLLVTDSFNHCVHYIDREGGLIQVILTQNQIGFMFHCGICVDDVTGQVWLGNTRNDVVIAKYLE